jgi:hypothetical protein
MGKTDDERTTVTYQFDCPSDTWRPWVNTIPRSTPIAERIRTLIEQDLSSHQQAATSDAGSDADKKDTALLATRIRIRATQATAALRDSDGVDVDTAREQLADIRQLAEAVES